MANQTILIINGPNLNLTGIREPDIYGTITLADIEAALRREFSGTALEFYQSNHAGDLIDQLQQGRNSRGIILNPGGLAHYAVDLRDAVAQVQCPLIEVHLSNIHARETFRQITLTGAAATGVISGLGPAVYSLALRALLEIA